MGHTNSTANLSLPQFIGTDKPTWLGDVNGAFSAIDSYAGTNDAAVAAAVSDAGSAVAQAASAVSTANAANTTAGNANTTANNAIGVANTANAIAGTVDSKVGLLADLTTTDRTSIVNAINEVNAAIGTPTAAQVSYDNTGSGLAASDVQDAIDEVVTMIGGGGAGSVSVTADGVKTWSQLLDDLYALVDQSKINDKTVISIQDATKTTDYGIYQRNASHLMFTGCSIDNTGIYAFQIDVKASGSSSTWYKGTYNDDSASAAPSGTIVSIVY